MTNLNGGFKKLVGKSMRRKRASAGVSSLSSGATRSAYSQDSVDGVELRSSLDAASSIYSPDTSAYDSPRPSGNALDGAGLNQRFSWLCDIADEPNSYSERGNDQTGAAARSHSMPEASPDSLIPTLPGPRPLDEFRHPFAGPALASRPKSADVQMKAEKRAELPSECFHGVEAGGAQHSPDRVEYPRDEDDKAIADTKRQIRLFKLLDIDLTRNALRMAHQAFEVGYNTLQTLQEQGERLNSAEEALQHAADMTEDTAHKLKELKQVHRMVRISERDEALKQDITKHDGSPAKRSNLIERDEARAANWQAWREANVHRFVVMPQHRGATHRDVLARAKYQFEDDSDDECIEDIIEGNVGELLHAVRSLKELAMATAVELVEHSDALDRTQLAVNAVDEGVARNRAALGHIG
ncbi:hypothetical protein FB567DRAFT_275047 [Paraphoma chrysanthemicola]|uniref:t-SNARE coiled-coil homology domain-containing protein n=1 Tax=Paraphoma chrysanthemicola TaxID=798071 RepID=A0A8K0W1C0_9PLEO|nr:hypothetical protein FB567DRAFT_275047 [Paraphoma chrysanthemicola]